MEKDSKTTVAVERTTFTKLDRLAKANNVSKMEFLTHAINYFEKYGINPVEHESPAQEMQKLIKRMDQVFAFLKKHNHKPFILTFGRKVQAVPEGEQRTFHRGNESIQRKGKSY